MRRALLWGALPAAAALLVFWPAARFGFVNFDDGAVLQQNPFIHSAWTFRGLLTSGYATTWAPLCWLSLRGLTELFGFRPSVFHVALLASHAASAIAVFALARESYSGPRRDAAAAFAALLFAVHPVQAESIAEAACMAVVPACLLALLSAWSYARGKTRAAWALALLSGLWHWEGVGLCVAILAFDWWRGKKAPWRGAVPFFAVDGAVAAANASVKHGVLGYSRFAVRPGAAALGALHAAASLVWPGERLPVYVYSGPGRHMGWSSWESVSVLACVTALLILPARRGLRAPLAAWASFLAFLAPPLLLTGAQPTWGHDHYLYLACVPIALLAGAALLRARSRAASAAALALVLCCGLEARRDARLWGDEIELWRHAFLREPSSEMFAFRLGEAIMFERDRVAEAISYFRLQRRLASDRTQALHNLGYAYNRWGCELMDEGRRGKALAAFEEALRDDPGRPEIVANLAIARGRNGILPKP